MFIWNRELLCWVELPVEESVDLTVVQYTYGQRLRTRMSKVCPSNRIYKFISAILLIDFGLYRRDARVDNVIRFYQKIVEFLGRVYRKMDGKFLISNKN